MCHFRPSITSHDEVRLVAQACSTGAHCIGVGMEQIQLNKHDIIFAGAGELENWGSTVMFDGMGALSSSYNDSRGRQRARFLKTFLFIGI